MPADLDLKRAVCSYGYYILAPNLWEPESEQFWRVLRLERLTGQPTVTVSARQPGGVGTPLRLRCDRRLSRAAQAEVRLAFRRMLRLDEDLGSWRRRHSVARRRGFLRMFRSPTLFEDMVKTITGCNVTWRNTIRMNQLLVERVGDGAFPSPERLAPLTPSKLKARCKVGYRATRIVRLARAFCDGEVDPSWYESTDRTTAELREALLGLEGFGPYAAANMLQLLGHYDHVPIDTETYRHYCHVTGTPRPKNDKELDPLILARYERYAPHQFMAYWFELWRDYERRYGDAWTWDAETTGASFTASVLKQSAG